MRAFCFRRGRVLQPKRTRASTSAVFRHTLGPLETISRRSLLVGGSAIAAFWLTNSFARDASGASSPPGASSYPKVVEVEKHAKGTTLTLALDHAPFPHQDTGFKDSTVMVFVPSTFRDDGTLDFIVHFHGHGAKAKKAISDHQLRGQLYESRRKAILVLPQGQDNAWGKLEEKGGLAALLAEVRQVLQSKKVRARMGRHAVNARSRFGSVVLSGHSGGYLPVARCIKPLDGRPTGGVDVREVWLFDALYNDFDVFRDWVLARKKTKKSKGHRLMSLYTSGTTMSLSHQLRDELEEKAIECATDEPEGSISREEFGSAQALFIQTTLSHHGCTAQNNLFRDLSVALSARSNARKGKKARKITERLVDL